MNTDPRATCRHPGRRAYPDDPQGRCKDCAIHAHLDATWVPPQPVRVLGVNQYASPEPPPACPKCHAGPSAWEPRPGARYVRCYACGRDWHRVGPQEMPALPAHALGRQPRLVGRA